MQIVHPNPREVVAEIAKCFLDLPEKLKDAKGNRAWTTELKKHLVTLGHKYGWDTCPEWDGQCLKWGWLYDLVWYKEDAGHLSEVGLVMESEWYRGWKPIKYDFEKLLLAKSALKLMIFQTDRDEISGLFDLLEKGIRAFSKLQCREEIYLLIAYDISSGKFIIHQRTGMGECMEVQAVQPTP